MTSPALPAAAAPRPFLPELVAASTLMREVQRAIDDVAPTATSVLLLGESGTGKEVLARHLHARSLRPGGPWVAVHCAALPADLLESELFGHERGAFPGAEERRAGRFEQASGGTLLLDEVAELPPGLQAKLLRVLEAREVTRVGGTGPVAVDVRIVATTNRDLLGLVRAGQFRSDLYYRLNVYPIHLPPLRTRPDDIRPLAERLLAEAAVEQGVAVPALTTEALAALAAYDFPGNARELRNLIERALVRCRQEPIEPRHLGLAGPDSAAVALDTARTAAASGAEGLLFAHLPIDLGQLEKLAIEEALRRVHGNRTHAARLLGIGLRTLRNKLKAWREAGLPVPPADPAERQGWPDEADRVEVLAPFLPQAHQARASQREWP